ncbi:HD domain-containing protein [Mucilaginibacter myungsuensis]|uniref:HD domain-containing protein n=1 Tax=Mucilaginibacter myungsuensis TaxID=649104 RepID=A0A929L2N5_9SPHI|nr:HD domain-containing protein [Mucilaginibacter myungsuensis]MBE9663359.1 HD domain-containing protein [Mucilaginibacter myungsuensis]MDN3600094.1 HD domain-containing protein [Mucilaginibacter myungsuensis]
MNKKKIINDPVYGFITIPSALVFDLIEHPYFQRLRYIKQGGMTHLVYPGALHTRFHHALGAMHLMRTAIETLCNKDVDISLEEQEAVTIAILLHDIGHGPFSHALEQSIVQGISHEDISAAMMSRLNRDFDGQLQMAIDIFNDTYPKRFLHQLVSSQLDVDRMDYLNRDSFFTGVSEGVISSERIIKMLTVVDDHIVVEEKGVYSIENFLISRRLMYWQVYLHKTGIAAEQLLGKILKRARELALSGVPLFATPSLNHFLVNQINKEAFMTDETHLDIFAKLDDSDIMSAIKVWTDSSDKILSLLCRNLINRKLYKVDISDKPVSQNKLNELTKAAIDQLGISKEEAHYFVFTDTIANNAYKVGDGNIRVLMKDGSIRDITTASDDNNLTALTKTVKKHITCYIKGL